MEEHAIKLLNDRGVTFDDIIDIVLEHQSEYIDDLDRDYIHSVLEKVLKKREVQNAVITGIEIDIAAEKGYFSPLLNDLLMRDEGLYGIDEILVLSICNVYGTIGLTNFGYLDKTKPGIIGQLNDHKNQHCNTFIDDIVGALAAATMSKIAHEHPLVTDVTINPSPSRSYTRHQSNK